jgi:hypothetical protein
LRTGDAEHGVPDEPDAHPEHRLPGLGREEEDPGGPGEEHRPHQELEDGPGQRRQRADGRGALGRRIAAVLPPQERLPFLGHGEGRRMSTGCGLENLWLRRFYTARGRDAGGGRVLRPRRRRVGEEEGAQEMPSSVGCGGAERRSEPHNQRVLRKARARPCRVAASFFFLFLFLTDKVETTGLKGEKSHFTQIIQSLHPKEYFPGHRRHQKMLKTHANVSTEHDSVYLKLAYSYTYATGRTFAGATPNSNGIVHFV